MVQIIEENPSFGALLARSLGGSLSQGFARNQEFAQSEPYPFHSYDGRASYGGGAGVLATLRRERRYLQKRISGEVLHRLRIGKNRF